MASDRDNTTGRASAVPVVGGMAASAIAGYLVLLVTARRLPVEANTEFLTFWAFQFFSFGMLSGLQSETTRSVRRSRAGDGDGPRHGAAGARVLLGAAVVALVMGATTLVMVPAGGALLGAHGHVGLAIAAVGTVLFTFHSAVNGALAGQGDWRRYGILVGSESTMRLVLITSLVVAASASVRLEAAELGTALAAGTWTVLALLSPGYRAVLASVADVGLRGLLANIARAIAGGTGNAVILVGFPVLLQLTTPAAEYRLAAPFLLAISLTRAPIMLPLSAFQSMVITFFMDASDRRAALVRLGAVIAGLTLVTAVVAALVGPALMALLFGPAYRVQGLVLGALTCGAGMIALETILGAMLMALDHQGGFAGAWLLTAAVAVVSLLLPLPMVSRAVLALIVGPVAGVLAALLALGRASK